ncbi:MAG: BspA family leucine-rich repeat surface protein, partial [Limosilactobacillus sp.]|uniref:BspA family leucine-rich repeat surface protein n=1 Tax=Limosilactobacillus sp. TaxID=2773925 RepID=UPI0027019F7D|nr:BspA family leucine-rich repeat surface protein [Limosilactobacillus sp.]
MKAQPTYRLRKLTIGFCSVTLMAIFAGHATVAHADEKATDSSAVTEAVTNGQTSNTDIVLASTDTDATTNETASSNETNATEAPDFSSLSLDATDQAAAKAKYDSADQAQKATFVNSFNTIKNFTISKADNTYKLVSYNPTVGVTDVVLPTLGDFTNLGLTCDKVTIDETGMKSVAATPGITSVSTSKAGGVVAFNDGSLYGIFQNKKTLQEVDLSAFDTSSSYLYDNRYLFAGCTALTDIDLSNWANTSVVDMSNMFSGCTNLQNLNLTGFNTSNVRDMSAMFMNCKSLASLDVTGFDTSKVNFMTSMFAGMSNLTSIDVSNFNTSKVVNMTNLFNGCANLTTLDLTNFDTSIVRYMTRMFSACSNLTEIKIDPDKFTTSKVLDFSDMFKNNRKLLTFDTSKFDTSSATDLSGMFDGCSALTHIDVSSFKTDKVVGMARMFSSCNNLKSVDVSHFDTSQVTNFSSMFNGCNSLKELDVSSFDGSQVKDASTMFVGCYGVTFLDIKQLLNQLPSNANVKYMLYALQPTFIIADKDKVTSDMTYVPYQPYCKVDGQANMVFVRVPTILDQKVDNISDYIKGYMDKAVADANYAYKGGAPTVYTLNMIPTVVPLYKSADFSTKYAIQNADGTVMVGDAADTVSVENGYKYDGTKYVINWDAVKENFNSGNPTSTSYAVGTKITPVEIADGVYGDENNTLYRFDNSVISTFNDIKDFVTTHLKTDDRGAYASNIADDGTVTYSKNGLTLKGTFDWETMDDVVPVSVDHEGYVINGQTTNPADSLTYDKDKVKSVAWKSTDALADLDFNDSTNLTAVVTFTDGTTKEVEIRVVKLGLASVFQNAIEDNMKPLYYSDNTPLTSVSEDVAKNVIGTPTDISFAGMTIKPEIKSYKYNDNGTITVTFGDDSNYDFRPEQTKVTASVDKDLVRNVSKDYGTLSFNVTPQTVGDVSGVDNSTTGTHTATVNVTMDNGQTLVVPFNYTVVDNDADNASITVKSPFFYTEGKLPEASSLLTGMPTDATAKWTKEPSEDDPAGVITVTFKDNTTADYNTTGYFGKPGDVLTGTEADLYDGAEDKPFGAKETFTFEEGKLPEASTLITGTLPDGATAAWKKAPTDEDPAGVITVTFADQSTTDLNTTGYVGKKIEALTGTEADLYDGAEEKPFGVKDTFTFVNGQVPDASTLITGTLPDGATPTWTKTPTEDDPAGVITVTFADKSTADFNTTGILGKPGDPLTGTEADLYDGAEEKPFGVKDTFTFVNGQVPEASTLITGTLPDGATPAWGKTPTEDDPVGVITVTFGDKSTADFNTTGILGKPGDPLTATEADLYDGVTDKPFGVKDIFTFEEGKLPAASTLITGTLPDGATASWKKAPTDEDPAGVITVTFADQSTIDLTTTGYVGKKIEPLTRTEADMYELDAKGNVTAEKGTEITAKDVIDNFTDFPEDVTWTLDGYDKDKVGQQSVTVTATFADGSTLKTTVNV